MDTGREIHQGYPDNEAVYSLLSESFSEWRSRGREYLRWKYDNFPGFEEDHVVFVGDDSEVIAMRRIFEKELVTREGSSHKIFIFGDTCVATSHRGEGLYTQLLNETERICSSEPGAVGVTYNRRGNIPFLKKQEEQWNFQTLPLYLFIVSPLAVIRRYSEPFISDSVALTRLVDLVGHTVGLSVGSEQMKLAELTGTKNENDRIGAYLPVPKILILAVIELFTSDEWYGTIRRRVRSVFTEGSSEPASVRIINNEPVSDSTVDGILELYELVSNDYELHFMRNRRILSHMLSHPGLLSVLVVDQNSEVIGFAALAIEPSPDIREAHVLDLVAKTDRAFNNLVGAIQRLAILHDVDLVAALAVNDPGPQWLRVDQQVIMWNEYDSNSIPLAHGEIMMGLYDVV